MDINEVQKQVGEVFENAFGRTPLRGRLDDIDRECRELLRYTDLRNLREEAGDLMASLFQLMNEAGWSADVVVASALGKIKARLPQYHSLGRKITVAIFGGAFDMPTYGHLDAAKIVLETSRVFDEVWLMPCGKHMHGKHMTLPEHRLSMCELLAAHDGRIRVSDYEIRNGLAGETYHLVNRLLSDEEYKDRYNFSLVIGQDNANSYHTWVNYEELERLIRHVVIPRVGYVPDLQNAWYLKPPHIYLCSERPTRDTSSTRVRSCYKELATIDSVEPAHKALAAEIVKLTTPEIHEYICRHGLYGMSESVNAD